MKITKFDPEVYIQERYADFKRQSAKLRELYKIAAEVAPEANITVWWYGGTGNLELNLYGKGIEDVPRKMAEMGLELEKMFLPSQGEFNYTYTSPGECIGEIEFTTLPPNCRLVEKTRTVPTKVEKYYEVECNNKEVIE